MIKRIIEFNKSRDQSLYKWHLVISESQNVTCLKTQSGFYADPFIYDHSNILCEFFSNDLGRGVINHIQKINGDWVDKGTIYDNGVHSSYPFILLDKGELFVVPEQSAIRKLEIFRIEKQGDTLIVDTSNPLLIQEVESIVDTVIVGTNDSYYFFYNVDLVGQGDPGNVLCCRKLKSLSSESWAHAKPVVLSCDVRKARNGGRVVFDSINEVFVRFYQKKFNFQYGSDISYDAYTLNLKHIDSFKSDFYDAVLSQTKGLLVHHIDFNDEIKVFDSRK